MAHYIDADKLIAEIERRRDNALERQKNLEKIGQETVLNEMIAFELNRLISFIDSLQQEPPIHTELCTLIACDVIQATAKRAIEKPQDKDKEEDLMIKKMEYLNMLEKSFFQQEKPEVDLEKEIYKEWGKCYPTDEGMGDEKAILVSEQFHQIARHFYELGRKAKEDK